MAERQRRLLIGSVVRLIDAPHDHRNGGYFRIAEIWESPSGPRYALGEFLGHQEPPEYSQFVVRGGTWNVGIEVAPTDAAASGPSSSNDSLEAAPLKSTPGPLSSIIDLLLPRATQNLLVSRRGTWDGAVIKALTIAVTDPEYGQYYRVRESWRDPATGAWSIQSDYLGPNPPPNEPIYKFDGTTWDMPAVATTVFPWGSVIALTLVYVLVFSILGPRWAANGELPAMLIVGVPVYFIGIGIFWYTNIEPVRGTKLSYAIMAFSAYRRATRDDTPYGQGPHDYGNNGQPSPFDAYSAKLLEDRERTARAAEVEEAVSKALREDRQKRNQWW